MVSLYIWLSIYTNNEILCIIWKFDLSSRGVLGRIYALSIEVLTQSNSVAEWSATQGLVLPILRSRVWTLGEVPFIFSFLFFFQFLLFFCARQF